MPQRREIPASSGRKVGAPVVSSTPKKVSETDSNITYEISVTKKIGDYEFIKLTAGVTVPTTITDAELAAIDDKMVVIRDKVITRLDEDFKVVNL